MPKLSAARLVQMTSQLAFNSVHTHFFRTNLMQNRKVSSIFILEKLQPFKCKIAASLACLALSFFVNSAWAQLTVTGADQIGSVPLTPTRTRAPGNLIAGLIPTVANGNFGEYTRSEERRVGKECRSRW